MPIFCHRTALEIRFRPLNKLISALLADLANPNSEAYQKVLALTAGDSFRIDIDGENIFASISAYKNRPLVESRLEFHERYIDIQYMIKGQEIVIMADHTGELLIPYTPEKDIGFFALPNGAHFGAEISTVMMNNGSALVIFPHEFHAPGVAITREAQETINEITYKCVIKIDTSILLK